MYTESYAEIYSLIQQYVLSIDAGKLKLESLNELSQILTREGIQDRRTNLLIRSVLSSITSGKRIGYSTLTDVHKYLKILKKPKNDIIKPLHEIPYESIQNVGGKIEIPTHTENSVKNFCKTYHLRSSSQSENHSLISAFIQNKPGQFNNILVPSVPPEYPTSISGPQETSKLKFLEYFRLGNSSSEFQSDKINETAPISLTMFKKSTNVPFSSDLGRLLAVRVNHKVSEDFKLRKIERVERYINKPYSEKIENVEYPVTFVEKNLSISPHMNRTKQNAFECKPVSVVLKNVDLLELQKRLKRNARKRKRYRLNQMMKTVKTLKVVLRPSDKKIIQNFTRKNKKKIF